MQHFDMVGSEPKGTDLVPRAGTQSKGLGDKAATNAASASPILTRTEDSGYAKVLIFQDAP